MKYLLFALIIAIACNDATTSPPQPIRVLVLGNSITQHGPSDAVGWTGDWGMAATSIEKDFVHVLQKHLIDSFPEKTFNVRWDNIASHMGAEF
jgi:hypothetical protein